VDVAPVTLPMLEPRGAVCATLKVSGQLVRVVGMHLDLSGLRRRHQVAAVCNHITTYADPAPAVLMGDMNEWGARGGALAAFDAGWRVLAPGRSFPARRPIAQLDRIVATPEWSIDALGVHHSPLAAVASDHLPVFGHLSL